MAVPQESDGRIEILAQKYEFKLHYTGIGMLAAAQKTTEVIINEKPSHIINLGTAGSRHLEIGELVECVLFKNRTAQIDSKLDQYIKAQAITELKQLDCGSADYIDYSENANDFQILDMEAYAIALVCHKTNIRFNSIKYITDDSKDNVSHKWREQLPLAAIKLSEYLEKLIQTKVLT